MRICACKVSISCRRRAGSDSRARGADGAEGSTPSAPTITQAPTHAGASSVSGTTRGTLHSQDARQPQTSLWTVAGGGTEPQIWPEPSKTRATGRQGERGGSDADLLTWDALRELEGGRLDQRKFCIRSTETAPQRQRKNRTKREQFNTLTPTCRATDGKANRRRAARDTAPSNCGLSISSWTTSNSWLDSHSFVRNAPSAWITGRRRPSAGCTPPPSATISKQRRHHSEHLSTNSSACRGTLRSRWWPPTN